MAHVTVVGLQWGDEGKGKIVDLLSAQAQAVVRFQGGHNAGHTLVINNVTYKLSLLPSGIVQGKVGILGNGVVIDPQALQKEIANVKERGLHVSPQTLKISDRAVLILSLHRELDVMREHAAGSQRIGTTGRGIGPAYEDKVGRRALRVCDLYDLNNLDQHIERLLMHHNTLRAGLGMEHIDVESLRNELIHAAEILLPYAAPVHRVIRDLTQQRQKVLFEGAQGALLDIEYGTYPYVTSSSTIAAQAALGSGSSPHHVGYILGVVKAYSTRVGEGPFLSELQNDVGQRIATRGREIGTVTGRARRCGAFDAVAARETALLCGAHGLALTKLDVLDEESEIPICIGYKLPDGSTTDVLPSSTAVLQQMTPIYQMMEGWQSNTKGIDSYANLPAAAIKYIRRIEELIGLPVDVLSTGAARHETIILRNPFDVM